jgi:hypothetical protein
MRVRCRGSNARISASSALSVRTYRLRSRRNCRNAAVWQPETSALRFPLGAPPFDFARMLMVLPPRSGGSTAEGGEGGEATGRRSPPPPLASLAVPLPRFAGEEPRLPKPLVELANRPEVVLRKLGGGGTPSPGFGSGGRAGRRSRIGSAKSAASFGAHLRSAITEPVAADAFSRRTTAPAQADFSRGSGAAPSRWAQACSSATCACSCASNARMYVIRRSIPRSIPQLWRW